jgi:hypothetical protein
MTQKIKLRITIQTNEELEMLDQWFTALPSLCFLDTCMVAYIKDYLQYGSESNKERAEAIERIKKMDKENIKISYFLALMEKTSDQKKKHTQQGLVEEIRRDIAALNCFFHCAKVYEPEHFAESFANELYGNHVEILGPAYQDFLICVNTLELHNSKKPHKKLSVCGEIFKKADLFGISRQHNLVVVTIACVYGCFAAQKVLKFCGNPENFDPSNAVADIQLIHRMAQLVQAAGINHIFMTGDKHLDTLRTYFQVESTKSVKLVTGEMWTEHKVTLDGSKLFPDLFDTAGECKETCVRELDKLYTQFQALPSITNCIETNGT